MQLGETLALRTPTGATLPLIEAGTPLPATRNETVSTGRDDQESVRCELVTLAGATRSVARLEVGVRRAPRGVAQVRLAVRVSADGSVHATLDGEHGHANASFSVSVA